jgi:hypothetical protein
MGSIHKILQKGNSPHNLTEIVAEKELQDEDDRKEQIRLFARNQSFDSEPFK